MITWHQFVEYYHKTAYFTGSAILCIVPAMLFCTFILYIAKKVIILNTTLDVQIKEAEKKLQQRKDELKQKPETN